MSKGAKINPFFHLTLSFVFNTICVQFPAFLGSFRFGRLCVRALQGYRVSRDVMKCPILGALMQQAP